MKIILINSKHGKFQCLIDDEDYEWVSSFKWRISKNGNTYYATTHVKTGSGRMHRMIYSKNYNLLDTQDIDHIDRNGLNNQKNNLRSATRSQNKANVGKIKINTSSIYKGVYSSSGGWRANIKKNNKMIAICAFNNERDAAIAYDIKAKELFGEYAGLNVPEATEDEINRVVMMIKSQKRKSNTTSIYYGVSKCDNRWAFHYVINGKMYRKYGFVTELEAALARNRYIEDNNLSVEKTII